MSEQARGAIHGGGQVLLLLPDGKTWMEHLVAYSYTENGQLRCRMTDGCDVPFVDCAPIKEVSHD